MFNLYLFISINKKNKFAIIDIQIDNTLLLDIPKFSALKDKKIVKIELQYKPKEKLSLKKKLNFNGNKLIIILKDTICL
jgi:hypothetical protein